jgi:hypothetical protein
MKHLIVIAKIVFCLLLLMPVIGALGVMPPPTSDMYETMIAFDFIMMLMSVKYITACMGIVALASIYFVVTKRTALAVFLMAPIIVCIVGFHAWVDGGLLTGGALMGNILLIISIFLGWQYRATYKSLLQKNG